LTVYKKEGSLATQSAASLHMVKNSRQQIHSLLQRFPVISWWSVLFVEETGVPRKNHKPVVSHWQTLPHNVVTSTPHHEGSPNSQLTSTLTLTLIPLTTIIKAYICIHRLLQNEVQQTLVKRGTHCKCRLGNNQCRLGNSQWPKHVVINIWFVPVISRESSSSSTTFRRLEDKSDLYYSKLMVIFTKALGW
jgi:hypothetical protein